MVVFLPDVKFLSTMFLVLIMKMNMICFCCATGDVSSVSGTDNDLRSDIRIGSKITKSADSSGHGVNTTYCLRGPTGSRLAARFVFRIFIFLFSCSSHVRVC